MTVTIRGRVRKKMGNPSFVKGKSGNPNGRPKGSYSDATLSFLKLKKLASTRANEAFEMLWQAMERGESWAHQIYFKELYSLPRNYDEKKIILEDKDTTIEGQIQALANVLPEFDEITHDDSLNRLKVLNSIKSNEMMGQQNNEIKETRESLLEKVELIQKVIDLKNKELES